MPTLPTGGGKVTEAGGAADEILLPQVMSLEYVTNSGMEGVWYPRKWTNMADYNVEKHRRMGQIWRG